MFVLSRLFMTSSSKALLIPKREKKVDVRQLSIALQSTSLPPRKRLLTFLVDLFMWNILNMGV